jgi:TetR/AcrR family fatty acid metabolism transcriptional regulator
MKSALRKKQIIETGKKLFAQNGYYGTHVESILREASIGKGTFYLYFKNKEDLFITILSDFLDEWEKGLKASLEGLDPADLESCYRTMIINSFRFFRLDPYISKIFVRVGPGLNEIFEPYIELFEQRMLDYLMDYLRKGIDNGLFRKDLDVELVSNVLVGGHLRIAYYYFINRPKNSKQKSIAHITKEVYSMVIQGLMA